MINTNAAIAVLNTHLEAEAVIKELQVTGFDRKKLSLVAKSNLKAELVIGYDNAGDRIGYQGRRGAIWSSLWGVLFGSAFYQVPGLGQLVITGPLVAATVEALKRSAIDGGAGSLGTALHAMGIPNDSIARFETAIKSDYFVLIAQGTTDEIRKVVCILNSMGHDIDVYRAPGRRLQASFAGQSV